MLYPFVIMGALLSLTPPLLVSMETCTSGGTPGYPGIPGLPGRNGRDGEMGQKGVAGVAVGTGQGPVKGQQGDPGAQGPAGKRGRSGDRGLGGAPGVMGPPGEKGAHGSGGVSQTSAFSVARGTATAPEKQKLIGFTSVITNINNDYNKVTGRFKCRIPGTYYFVYHASSEDKLCVHLKLDGTTLGAFCDLDKHLRQVSSGGLAVYLRKDQEVWLETNDNNGMTSSPEGNSIFSGFLLYAQ